MPMNQLQLVLLAIAGVLLLALYLWGKWQQRRALREFEQSLQVGVSDALMSTPAAEPSFGQTLKAQLHSHERREPSFASALEGVEETTPEAPVPSVQTASDADDPLHWIEDPLLDCVIELSCTHAVDGVGVFDAAAPLTQAQLPLPMHLVVWDARTERWVRPDRFGFYSELLVAVQLAHRRAQLGEVEVARFLSAVEQVAVRLDADFDAPEAAQIVKLSQQLAQTCARFDVQVGLTVQATHGPWEAGALTRALAHCGLTQAAAGAMRWLSLNAQGQVLFSLTPTSLLADRLMLELDVPTVPMAADALRQMFGVAQQLCASLNARLVDDNGRAIDAAALGAIETQLQSLLVEMRAVGIEPGSARALRLYGPLN